MCSLFDRIQTGFRASFVCLTLLGFGLALSTAAASAMDGVAGEIEQTALTSPVQSLAQPVAMVLPFNPSARPPMPIHKPGSKPGIVAISTGAAASAGVIAKAVEDGETDSALRMLNHPTVARSLSVNEYDRLRVKVAAGFLTDGELKTALNLSRATLRRSGGDVPQAGWVAGITAWRLHDYDTSLAAFAVTAASEKADDWTRAGAAFWAARAAEQLGDMEKANAFRNLAAQFDRTFYGLLAIQQLGQAPKFNWDAPLDAAAHRKALAAHPLAATAFEQIANGRLSAADQTLLKIAQDGSPEVRMAALGLAVQEGLPATALRMARQVEDKTGVRYDAAYYPLGNWMDDQDYRVDRALVHAIVRQESKFDPKARSGQGAVGLMQLLPTTATYVIKVRAGGRDTIDLNRSVDNLDVGQHYLEHLLSDRAVNQNLLNLLVAYNAGPGNLAKWQKNLGDMNDPLLFVESIPSPETRAYVERVMASYWIYRDRLGLGNPTLTTLARGQTVTYNQPAGWADARIYLTSMIP